MKASRYEQMDRIEALLTEPMEIAHIAKAAGLSYSPTRDYLGALHADRRIHICGWRQVNAHSHARQYIAGSGEDAPKPACIKKKKGDRFEQRIVRDWKRNAKRDPLTAALFGGAA